MDPSNDNLKVERVKNGWIVSSGSMRDVGRIGDLHVAVTPEQLCDLLWQWAKQQHDKGKTV